MKAKGDLDTAKEMYEKALEYCKDDDYMTAHVASITTFLAKNNSEEIDDVIVNMSEQKVDKDNSSSRDCICVIF